MIGKILINSNNNVNDKVAKSITILKINPSEVFLHEFCNIFLRTAVLQNACAWLSICGFVLLVTHLCKSICTNKDDKLHARHTVSYTRNSFLKTLQKQVLLKNLQNSQKNNFARVSWVHNWVIF